MEQKQRAFVVASTAEVVAFPGAETEARNLSLRLASLAKIRLSVRRIGADAGPCRPAILTVLNPALATRLGAGGVLIMMKMLIGSILLSLMTIVGIASGQATQTSAEPAPILGTPAAPPADKSKFAIILLVGQSNMAGRAPLTDADRQPDPRVLVLNRADQWYSQGEPIHYDKPKVIGVGPGFTFAKLLADNLPGVTIGIVPCAFGGTSLAQWNPKSKDLLYPPDNLYNNAVRRAKIAMQTGTLTAILWHQGESDAGKNAGQYAAQLAKFVAKFRADLDAPSVPFIAGEIGAFDYTAHPFKQTINQQIDTIPGLIPNSAVASSDGLHDKGDHLHFDNASQKELAARYLAAFLRQLRK